MKKQTWAKIEMMGNVMMILPSMVFALELILVMVGANIPYWVVGATFVSIFILMPIGHAVTIIAETEQGIIYKRIKHETPWEKF